MIYLGMDVHKNPITIAVLPQAAMVLSRSSGCRMTCRR
jgi:hypothetical protein